MSCGYNRCVTNTSARLGAQPIRVYRSFVPLAMQPLLRSNPLQANATVTSNSGERSEGTRVTSKEPARVRGDSQKKRPPGVRGPFHAPAVGPTSSGHSLVALLFVGLPFLPPACFARRIFDTADSSAMTAPARCLVALLAAAVFGLAAGTLGVAAGKHAHNGTALVLPIATA